MIAVSSIVRHAPPGQQSSFLTFVDPEQRAMVARYALPESEARREDPNPRGGMRGARGLAVASLGVLIATGSEVFVIDRNGMLERELSHPLAGGIHDLLATEDGFWLAATSSNMALLFSYEGVLLDSWHWSDGYVLPRQLGLPQAARPPADVDYRVPSPGIGIHDVTHLNGMTVRGNELFLSLGQVLTSGAVRQQRLRAHAARLGSAAPGLSAAVRRFRAAQENRLLDRPLPAPSKSGSTYAIAKVPLEGGRVSGEAELAWSKQPVDTPKHNLLCDEDHVTFADSDRGAVVWVDLSTGSEVSIAPVPGSPPFVRGLCELGDGRYAVGSQRPLSVSIIDSHRRLIDTIDLPGQPWETTYALAVLPESHSGIIAGLSSWADRQA